MILRAISALIAIALLAVVFQLWQAEGLMILCSIAILIGTYEYSRLTFAQIGGPFYLRAIFFVASSSLYFTTLYKDLSPIFVAAIGGIVFLAATVVNVNAEPNLPKILRLQNAGLMGLFYCGIFPGLAVRLLRLGPSAWFFGLLAIVFAGDTGAYLAGRFFGRTKLLEAVSPKKTIEGAIGGLLGSVLAGVVLGRCFFSEIPFYGILLTALVTGAFAQIGDLFESMLKRVADVKDSGGIMPGHGGLLDRLDGVLFAAPIYYVLAMYLLDLTHT